MGVGSLLVQRFALFGFLLLFQVVAFGENQQIQADMEAFVNIKNERMRDIVKGVVRKSHYLNPCYHTKERIPRRIHQIWLGPKPIPELYKRFSKCCKLFHPNWEYKLWTDKDLSEDLETISMIRNAKNYGMKSDILRYELLYKFGGIYLDMDCCSLKSLEPIASRNEMIISYMEGMFYIATIGARPKHPFLRQLLDSLHYTASQGNFNEEVMQATGPYFYTRELLKYISLSENTQMPDISIYPANYFLPLVREFVDQKEKTLKRYFKGSLEFPKEAFLLHSFGQSWIHSYES